MLALPASAGQRIITYRGETFQAEVVRLKVLKRDSGARFITGFAVFFTMTCEDASIGGYAGWISTGGMDRLGEGGEFEFDSRSEPSGPSFHFAGTVRFGSSDGTLEVNQATLTDDDQAQLCTTGVVDWSADRIHSRPARINRVSPSERMTLVGRNGDRVEVVP